MPVRRLSAVLAAAALVVLMTNGRLPEAAGQESVEGTVWLMPPISRVPADAGPFTVFVLLEDLQHVGALSYDDNRDTVPDRQVESVGLAAFEVRIQYDNRILAFVDAEEGPDLSRSGRSFDCLPPALKPDSVSFGCVSPGPEPPGPQGTMTLAAVTFQPVGTGTSPLVLEAGLTGPLGSDTVPIDIRGGVARVVGPPGPNETAQPTGAAIATAVAGAGTRTAPSTTEPNGRATPAATGVGDGPNDLVTGPDPDENENGASTPGDGPSSRMALWLGVGLGGASAVAFATLIAILWRRRYRAGP